ncbi:YibE/F family protein [Anoxybacterium hadale]|uniref:YibE/F family protein n=1 Tax=Anoxybacterium hadale TaxID=3408580 RepID=UPI003AFFF6ED
MKDTINKNQEEIIFILVFLVFIVFFAALPTGFEKQIYVNSEGVKAQVLSVNNASMYKTGMVTQGEQNCLLRIETGPHKGEEIEGVNLFVGKYEFDKVFKQGDKAWVLLEFNQEGKIIYANMIDYYRIHKELVLVGIFALVLVAFSGLTGIRTLLSFIFAILSIWKLLIPLMLKGYDPLLIGLIVGNLLTITTLLLVAGFTKKAYAAMISASVCSLITAVVAVIFTDYFHIDGTVMQWSESLLYAGFMSLNLTGIFQAGIYLACSGAIMDLAIDISAALDEIAKNNSAITRASLIKSGLTIGKAVVGTQTTTLLLAYMGSYISVMMVFMAQGTPLTNILTSKAISAELLHTFVGCLGLVLVSPLTSIICGFLFDVREKETQSL